MPYAVNIQTVHQFSKGDKKAFACIFHDLYPTMLCYAERFVRDVDESEDLVQDAFVELWNARQKFESASRVKAFLYLTIKNKCLNHIKHLKVVDQYISDAPDFLEDNFETETIRMEMVYQLRSAIKNLSTQRRKIILLSMKGLKNSEIAEFLGISVNTVKLQKKIAYQALRNSLSQQSLILLSFYIFPT